MVTFLAAELVRSYQPVLQCQEELNLFNNSMAPFEFAQMAPVVEVNRAYNLISSSCRQSLSLGGGMMMGFSQPCNFTFYRAVYKYSHCFCTESYQLHPTTPPPQTACNEEVSVCIKRDGGAMSGDEKR